MNDYYSMQGTLTVSVINWSSYHIEENVGDRKLGQIHCKNVFGRIKSVDFMYYIRKNMPDHM